MSTQDHLPCHECGLPHRLPDLPRGAAAYCRRCGALLRKRRGDPWQRTLPLALAALPLIPVIVLLPFVGLNIGGQQVQTWMFSGPIALRRDGLWELAGLVLATSFLIPVVKLLCLVFVLVGLRLKRPPRAVVPLFHTVGHLGPWAMVEVFLLGLIVAYTKLAGMAQVEIGPAAWAVVALMVLMAAVDTSLDQEAVWQAIDERGLAPPPAHRPPDPASLERTWALLIAAAVLYVPANLYPIMRYTSLGKETPATIMEGVVELADGDTWPLAVLVFFASITVPTLKLIGMAYMLIATGRGSRSRLRDRARLYRIVEFVGRWSMIDVFMISILVSLVNMGALITIAPGIGAVAFAAVVILTMLAALAFDPRLMWHNAQERGR
ncbi:MAG: paraquat-inducible protein A [Rhodospirillales bacterium]|nr:paraquat-inducible protein A [Rhodospirillales bacterium]